MTTYGSRRQRCWNKHLDRPKASFRTARAAYGYIRFRESQGHAPDALRPYRCDRHGFHVGGIRRARA